jgi:hypothetical protein
MGILWKCLLSAALVTLAGLDGSLLRLGEAGRQAGFSERPVACGVVSGHAHVHRHLTSWTNQLERCTVLIRISKKRTTCDRPL